METIVLSYNNNSSCSISDQVTCKTAYKYWRSWDIHRFSKFSSSLRNICSDTVFSIALVQTAYIVTGEIDGTR